VLVARHDAAGGAELPGEVLALLRASAGLAEPLLRQWREAERGLLRHALDALRGAWRKLWGPGHLSWKVGALALVAALAVLLAWPVPDRVNASTVIEGRTRQLITAPFDGFIAQVLVRPGERVARGQVLARLDDRELKLEQGKHASERDQAAGKLRQAMSERDAPAMASAQAEVRQAEAQLALVEAKLARAGLVAPIDGLVVTGDWAQQIGGPVETGKEMFEIATTDGYRVVLHVPDRDIARVRSGQQGALRLTGQPQTAYGFEVTRVTATASVQDGVNGFRVEAAWQGSAPPLSPGMQGVGKVEVGEANLLTVWTRSSIDWLRLKIWSWWW
jgi:multidrug resistance efflux pump